MKPLDRGEKIELASLAVGFLALAGTLFAREQETTYWRIVLTIVACIAVLTPIVTWSLRKYRRFKLVHDFKGYCVECQRMIKRGGVGAEIMTIQTPVGAIPNNAKTSFESYINTTFEIIVATERPYKRLVVLDERTVPEDRIKDFVNQLIDRAKRRETTHNSDEFDLRNVKIGFVRGDSVRELLYFNLDIHCTTDTDFSIAFMAKEAIQGIHFGASLHLHDSKRALARLIRNDLTAAWNHALTNSSVITIGDFYSNFSAGSTPKTDNQADDIKASLIEAIDRIVLARKDMICPCPAFPAPEIFLERLQAANPTLLSSLKQLLLAKP
jgi:hypothetical protein